MSNMFLPLLIGVGLFFTGTAPTANASETDFLYYRDANVPPFQKSREFFDMPNRSGMYEVTMVSDTAGPLTFRIVRVHEDKEETMLQRRSYRVGSHEFQARFNNPGGTDDLIVEIANSNPAAVAKVSVYVVELPK